MKKKILLVDDERAFCRVVKLNLEAAGDYEVFTCSESPEALRVVKELQPDLILLDILMPKLSGPDLLACLKKQEETNSIPVVFITAIVTPEEARQKNHAFGNHCVVAKPIRVDELKQVVETALQSSDRYQKKIKTEVPSSGVMRKLLSRFRQAA